MHNLDSAPGTTGCLTRYQRKAMLLSMTVLLVVLVFMPTLWQKAKASKLEPVIPASVRSAANPVAMQMAMGGCTGANFSQAMGSPVATGPNPESVAVGDFNGDDIADLVTANFFAENVSILLGNGSGGFTEATGSPVSTGTGTIPYSVVVGDFNNDGKDDLATANPHPSNNVSVLLGNGSGGFTAATGSPVAVVGGPLSLAIGDFNRDGKADLVTANILANNVTTLSGNGAGGFAAGVTVGAGSLPNFVRVGDFNNDGRDDLVSTNNTTNTVVVLLATAAGSFSAVTPAPAVGSGPGAIGVGDFNRDGKLDLATANSSSDSITILTGNGSGGFAAGVTVGAGDNPLSIAVGDLNQDGKPDLAALNNGHNEVSILAGDGSGGFTQAAGSGLGVGNGPTCLAIGDFNRDGKDDIATSNKNSSDVTVLLNTCEFSTCSNTNFAAATGSPITVGDEPQSMAMGDFNQDGKADLAVVNTEADNLSILLGNGLGGFSNNGTLITRGNAPVYVAVGDFNRDGKEDLAVANALGNNVGILIGLGNGSFNATAVNPVGIGTSTFPSSVTVGDFNNDGKDDLATSNNNNSVTIMLGNGSGGFSQAAGSPYALGNFPQSAQVGDFNNDGNADLVVVNLNGSSNVSILLGNGSGGFSQPAGSPFATGGGNSDCVRIGDFNQDGKEDLVASHVNGGGTVGILVGDGMGSFSHAVGSPIFWEDRPTSIAIGDFNRDGKEDLAFTSVDIFTQEENVDILLGNGMARFSKPVSSRFAAEDHPTFVMVGDFNQDGKDDIATTNFDDDKVAVLLNTCVDNTAPTITASPVSRIASSPASNSQIARVADAEDAENTLTVEVNGGTSATVNGVTVSGISVNAIGVVTADVAAACGATTANFILGVTDSRGLNTETMLTVTVTPDNQLPTIICPANITTSATTGMCKAAVSYNTPTVSDNCPGIGTPSCSPASGSDFAKGTTTVTCSVNDAAGNSASCSFTVTVTDTQSPSITCPANITVNATTGACTAVVTYLPPAATDNCPGVGSVTCSPSSGSTFQKGTATVTCNVTDASSNTGSCSFTVTVNDVQHPTIVCPANITKATAINQCQAVVTYAAPTVADNCPGVGAPSCSPVSGSTFPKGVTTVSCMVRDASNNQATCAFTVAVLDIQAPTMSNCPSNIITNTLNAGDASVAVTFPAPAAADNCPGVAVVCSPPSASAFPRGVTTVICTATDASANQTTCSFTVRVFDYVIVDDTNGKLLRFDSVTGEYDFFDCRKNKSLSGRGTVTRISCKTELRDSGPDPRKPDYDLLAQANPCSRTGTATLTYQTVTHTLNDLNLSNNAIRCP